MDRAALELQLLELRRSVLDPREGIFGPHSKVWEVNRSSAVFLGAGRAALLQLAHPWVATAIDHHSRTRDDPIGRFQRTFAHVFSMVFGDLDAACRSAHRVHAVHQRVQGELPEPLHGRYLANDPEALLWVHATLWDTSLRMFEAVVRPLRADEKERYYAETRRFAALFGIPESVLPDDFAAFQSYVEGQLDGSLLQVTPAAAEMGDFVLRPLWPVLGPLMRRYRAFTADFLPERLVEAFDLPRRGSRERRAGASMLRVVRAIHPRLPDRLRELPPYVEARRRLAGQVGRDRLGERLTRVFVGSAADERGSSGPGRGETDSRPPPHRARESGQASTRPGSRRRG